MSRLSVGILAHNEERTLPRTLHALAQQTVFASVESCDCEIVVVANGCTDRTASVAEAYLKEFERIFFPGGRPRWRVVELAEAGKANAWNVFVHTVSDPGADYLVLMDADIELLEPGTLAAMQAALDRSARAWVAVDRPVKDVLLKARKAPVERLSTWATLVSGPPTGGEARLCGQLYMGRASILRKLWLPRGLPTQDGFLYTMLTTNGLAEPVDRSRVVRADGASHLFRGCVRFRDLVRHECWLIAGGAVSTLVYRTWPAGCSGLDQVGDQIRVKNEADPDWLARLIRENLEERWWVIPRSVLLRRFVRLRQGVARDRVRLAPLAFLAFIADFLLAVAANFHLRSRQSLPYWRQTAR